MKCLVVIAHPLAESLCRSLADEAIAALRRAGHTIEVLDLHAEAFEPAMTPEERKSYGHETMADQRRARQLTEAEILVLVFPVWWSSFPAMLKGWFDRTWVPGVAFDHSPHGGALIPRLHGLRHALAITTFGGPAIFDWLVMWQPVRRVLQRAIIGACAPRATFRHLALYGAETVTPERYNRFADKIRNAVARL